VFFNIGAGEMMLIAIVLLIAVGPEQLPGVIRRVGRTMGQLKSMSDRLRDDFMSGMNQIEEATDVKSWADKLETPWADPIDNSSWAQNIDPPFTAKRAQSDDSDGSDGGHDDDAGSDGGNDDDAGSDGDGPEQVEPGPGAEAPADDEHELGAETTGPGRPESVNPPAAEPATSTNGHSDLGRADEAPDPMAGERE
jgi:sec-independent protein translocase protein TatB